MPPHLKPVFAFYLLYKGPESASSQIDEAMAAFTMKPVTMRKFCGDEVSLCPVFDAVENEAFGLARFFKEVEASIDCRLVTGRAQRLVNRGCR
jgi:hypothetical protein